MNILFIGPPGSGKGTQAQKLAAAKNFAHLSTGDLFRKNLKGKTSLGQKAQSYIDQGVLVPDEVTNAMVEEFVRDVPIGRDILFDGFPRNFNQSEALDDILKKTDRRLNKVFFLTLSDDLIVERLRGRLWAPKSGRVYHIKNNPPKRTGFCDVSGEALIKRSDDREELVRPRLQVFHKETKPLLKKYEENALLVKVKAKSSPEEVFQEILQFFLNK